MNKGKLKVMGILALFLLLSLVLYGNTLAGEFVYDDFFFLGRPELREPTYLTKIWLEPLHPRFTVTITYRPLTTFSLALNFIFSGLNTTSFHLVNVILNGLVIFLVYLLILKIFKNNFLALTTALIFGFLPIHTEAVSFIKSRDELLSAATSLFAWLLFLKSQELTNFKKLLSLSASAFFWWLGLLAKEFTIVMPALFLAVPYLQEKPKLREFFKMSIPFILFLSLYLVMRKIALGDFAFKEEDTAFVINPLKFADFPTRVLTAFKLAFLYLQKTFIPINLSATYHYNQIPLVTNLFKSPEAISGVLLLLLLLLLTFNKKTRESPLGIGALIFLVPYFMFSKFIFAPGDFFAEHWMYFPSIGLSLLSAFGLTKLSKQKLKLALAIFVVILAFYGVLTVRRNKVWQSKLALYQSMIRDSPQSVIGHTNLAQELLARGRLTEAKKEVEVAFRIFEHQAYPPLLLNVAGDLALAEGGAVQAERFYREAIETDPLGAAAYSKLAKLYYLEKRFQEAERVYRQIIEFSSPSPRSQDVALFSLTLVKQKRYQEALALVMPYTKYRKGNELIRFAAAVSLYRLGKVEESKEFWDFSEEFDSHEEARKILEF